MSQSSVPAHPRRAHRRLTALVLLLVAALVAAGCSSGSHHVVAARQARSASGAIPGADEPRPAQLIYQLAPHAVGSSLHGRPNIFVIETDDMRWDDLRFMPNVRHLIEARGLSFENSFAPYPLCCPSRSSFLTGKYAHNHHVYSTQSPWGFAAFRDHHTVATVLQARGYETSLIGKYLNGYGQQPIRGTHTSSLHYVPPGWTTWMGASDHNWKPGDPFHGSTYNYFNLVQNINGRIVGFPGQYTTDVMARETRQVVSGFASKPAPWFVWWTPVAPHFGKPYEPDDPLPHTIETPARPDWVKGWFDASVTHGLGAPPNRSPEADVSDKPLWVREQRDLTPHDRVVERTITRQRAEALFVLDVQIGRTLAELSRTGALRNTVIVFTSDNGYYLGEHRKMQGKITLHEPSLRVPLLMAGPGIPHGRRYDPVTTIDLAPTFADLAGTSMGEVDGHSLVSLVHDGDSGWTRPVVTEGRMMQTQYVADTARWHSPFTTRGVRLGRWKYTVYSTGEEELYDLLRDPLELRSLARVPAYAARLRQMRAILAEYENCAGVQCRAPLPASLQLDPAQEKALTVHEILATDRYFDNPVYF